MKTQNDTAPIDVHVRRDGYSMVVLTPATDAGRAWIDEHLHAESWQWLGGSLAIDGRYAEDILDGMLGDGLEVG
jgi:hypothetical protein